MGTRSTVGHYNFEAWDLPTKYGWMHSGPGVQAATQVQDVVKRLSERMISSGELMGRLLDGAEWVGAAATAAGQAMQRGATQINQTAVEAATAQRCVTELGESFATAQHRVPAPNEEPTGLGDRFLFGAAEAFNALSPFDVQSPLHEAMEKRRELDQQANLALTDHMNASRERVTAMPVVTAPAPITVAAVSAGAPGIGSAGAGGVGLSARALPAAPRAGSAPTATHATGWATTPSPAPMPPAGPGPVAGPAAPPPVVGASAPGPGAPSPLLPPFEPAFPGPTAPTGGGLAPAVPPAVFGPPGTGSRGTGVAAGPGSRIGDGAARGTGIGARPGIGGQGIAGRGISGLSSVVDPVAGESATAVRGGVGAGRPGPASSFLQSPLGSRSGDDDREHKDRYAQHTDHIVGDLPLVAQAVIGETPEEEDHRLRHAREGR